MLGIAPPTGDTLVANAHLLRRIAVMPVLAFGVAALLGGCVAYPAGYGYGYEPAPYYVAPAVGYDGRGWERHHHRER